MLDTLVIIVGAMIGIVTPFIAIYWLAEGFLRLDENQKRKKTLRRMNDFNNVYWDYNHNIWVTKVVAEQGVQE